VLSNSAGVREDVRQRVLKVVQETGYVPNVTASALARQRFGQKGLVHRTIVVAICEAGETSFARLWEETYGGVLAAADDLNLAVSLCLIRPEETDGVRVPAALSRIPFDGILATTPRVGDLTPLARMGPTVLMGSVPSRDYGLPSVEPDNAAGMQALVDHLLSLGHRRLEFVPSSLGHPPYRERADAFESLVRHRRIEGRVAGPVEGDPGPYAAAFARRDPGRRPTALLVSSDGTAVQLLHALLGQGVRVPQDVSVVGFDGRAWGRDSVPPLTSWHPNWTDLGRKALRLLVDVIGDAAPPSRLLIGGDLLLRRSTGPAPACETAGGETRLSDA